MTEIDRLSNAIASFNKAQAELESSQLNQAFETSLIEGGRRKNLVTTLVNLTNPELNTFLRQETSQSLLDNLGILKSNKKRCLGIKIREFEVNKTEQKFGYKAILAYIAGKSDEYREQQRMENLKIEEEIAINLRITEGLVIVKEVGSEISKDEKTGKSHFEMKIEIIRPQDFEQQRIFDTIFTPEVSPETINNWFNTAMISFIQRIEEASK